MHTGRSLRKHLCRFMAAALMWAQFAVAAYACPGPQAMPTMDDCPQRAAMQAEPDARPSALCAEHCRHGQQADQVNTATLPAVVLTRLYDLPEPVVRMLLPTQRSTVLHGAFAAADPPHAILHCCLRT